MSIELNVGIFGHCGKILVSVLVIKQYYVSVGSSKEALYVMPANFQPYRFC